MALIGYARCSTDDQHPEAQADRLKAAGCTRVYMDHAQSGAKNSRPEWDKCLERLEPGDVLIATKLDRFSRSLHHLSLLGKDFQARGLGLRLLDQPIDTTTPEGRLFYHILGAFAEYERDLMITRTKEGLEHAKGRGRSGGRKSRLSPQQEAGLRAMWDIRGENGKRIHSIMDLRVAFAVNGKPLGRTTVYRVLGMNTDSDRAPGAEERNARHAELGQARESAQEAKARLAAAEAAAKPEQEHCLTCGAAPGEPCHKPGTGGVTATHRARKTAATLRAAPAPWQGTGAAAES